MTIDIFDNLSKKAIKATGRYIPSFNLFSTTVPHLYVPYLYYYQRSMSEEVELVLVGFLLVIV